MQVHDFTTDDGIGICTLCRSECWIVNGVPMHSDGWRDDVCYPCPADVRLGVKSVVPVEDLSQRSGA